MKQKKKFSKKVEDFTCEVCGQKVKGSGYTDHCPHCLFSKHVDLFPGDRKAKCKGLMEPIGVIKRKGKWQILYRCQKCGHERFNKIAPEDNQEEIAELSRHFVSDRR
jgi:rubrerythrin